MTQAPGTTPAGQAALTTRVSTISELDPASPLDGSELLPMDQGSDTVKVSAQQIADLAPGTNLGYEPSTRTLISSTGDDVEIPEASSAISGLLPAAWIAGTEPAQFPHVDGNLSGCVHEDVRNDSGVPMAALTPYHVVGAHGDTSRVLVVPARASDPSTMPASGILLTALGASGEAANGLGAVAGVVTGVNAGAWLSGAELCVGTEGGLSSTRPTQNIQTVAVVGRSHAVTGSLALLLGSSLGSAARASTADFATAAQGALAASAIQPGNPALSDARTPTAHAASHATGGSDAITPSSIGAATVEALAAKADLVNGVVPTSQIPATALSSYLGAVGSESAMLALVGQSGDWCIRTDPTGSDAGAWFVAAEPSSLIANWIKIPMPAVPVQSVNGQVGLVILGAGDVGADPAGTANTALANHVAAADPHPGVYLTSSDIVAGSGVTVDTTTPGSAIISAMMQPGGLAQGFFIAPPIFSGVLSAQATGNQQLRYYKIYIDTTITPTNLYVRTNTTYQGTTSIHLGIYAHNATTNRPGARIFTSGGFDITVPTATASQNFGAAVTSVTLTPGYYWLAVLTTGITGTASFLGISGNVNGVGWPFTSEYSGSGSISTMILQSGIFSLPATAGGSPSNGNGMAVFLVY